MKKNSLPETSPSPWPFTKMGCLSGFLVGLSFPTAGKCLRVFAQHPIEPVSAVIMLGAVFGLLGFGIYYFCRWFAGLDEMQRLIQFKAFAWVVPIIFIVFLGNDLLRASGISSGLHWDAISLGCMMVGIYYVIFCGLWWKSR